MSTVLNRCYNFTQWLAFYPKYTTYRPPPACCYSPHRAADYCVQPVCLCVCLSASISREPLNRSARNFVCRFPVGRGWVLLRRCCAALCTSGFVDDVTCGRNGREAGKDWQHSGSAINYVRKRGGVWCLWMPVYLRSVDVVRSGFLSS